ncbi:hypothetical protein MN202_05965 [Rheinheimera muenzenbergensis]|uniref:Uncharacterized protein n=1 Tax=Rheinheimera muenzenbergensis TaxID=1193628 RepID=A0ABU8C4D0_9GAMM
MKYKSFKLAFVMATLSLPLQASNTSTQAWPLQIDNCYSTACFFYSEQTMQAIAAIADEVYQDVNYFSLDTVLTYNDFLEDYTLLDADAKAAMRQEEYAQAKLVVLRKMAVATSLNIGLAEYNIYEQMYFNKKYSISVPSLQTEATSEDLVITIPGELDPLIYDYDIARSLTELGRSSGDVQWSMNGTTYRQSFVVIQVFGRGRSVRGTSPRVTCGATKDGMTCKVQN